MKTFNEILTEAVSFFEEKGYVSDEDLALWTDRLRSASDREMGNEKQMIDVVTRSLRASYDRDITRGAILKTNPAVSRMTLARVKPSLRAELDRRIMASASLIKLNRHESKETTLRRFSGWATSIPPGGSR